MKYLISILALAAVGFLAWYMYKGQKTNEESPANSNQPATTSPVNSDWLFGLTPITPLNKDLSDPDFLQNLADLNNSLANYFNLNPTNP